MEMGEWVTYFIQYQGTNGRWFTKQEAYGSLERACEMELLVAQSHNTSTRIVSQTLINRVV